MSRKHKPDLLSEYQEFIEHRYHRSYWLHRFGYMRKGELRWKLKHNRISGLVGMVVAGTVIMALINKLAEEGEIGRPFGYIVTDYSQPATVYFWGMMVVFIYVFFTSAILFVQNPYRESKLGKQDEHEDEKKKKQPKRRKDYK